MLAFLPGRVLIPLCLVTTAACSSGSGGPFTGSSYDDGGTPTPTPTGTGTAPPTPDKPDGSTPTPDAGPVIDKTVHFDLTLDGDPIAITKVTVKMEPASGSSPASIAVAGQYEQQLGHGLTSTATFTVSAATTEKGADACGTGGRYASYLFKDTDGTIRIVSTSLQGGSCTMKIFGNAADDFTSGSATGVIGGLSPKAFTVAWGQPIPKP
jgi:hypothetical protein